MGAMDTDLVGTPRVQFHLQQTGASIAGQGTEQGTGRLACGVHGHDAFASLELVLAQGGRHRAGATRPVSLHQRQVALVHAALAQQFMQVAQGAAFLGNDQAAGGVAIQTVHQLQHGSIGTCRPQGLDDTMAHAAASMHRHAGRLVEDQQSFVLEEDGGLDAEHQACRRSGGIPLRLADGGKPDLVAVLDPVFRFDATLVDPDLALAQEPVDTALGDTFQLTQQVVIDALPRLFRAYLEPLHRIFDCFRHARMISGRRPQVTACWLRS